MASTLIRRTFRLSLTSPLFRRRQPLSVCSSSFSSCRCPNCCPVHLNRTTLSAPISVPSVRFFSSKVGADENLKKVLEAEIQQAKDDAEEHEQEALPSGFPFVIEDNPGDQTITLERVYSGEKIRATVYLNLDPDESLEDEDDDDKSGDDDEEKGSIQSNISMVVTIDKGEDSMLEFCCILGPEEIQIDSMTTKKHNASDSQEQYEGPPFSDLDENLQSEFYKYLEVRGIKSSLFDFLQDYMVRKDEREYLTWLKNMKKFVEV